jgi:uncharacterized membrane protein YoaK (UPF0700 family)
MFWKRRPYEYLSRSYVGFWFALAFQAGFANAGGFLACHRFVSHMTGFGTQMGVSMAHSEYFLAFEMLSAPLSFIAGAMVSAFFVDRRMALGKRPAYLTVMGIVSTVFLAVTWGGISGFFGEFGEPLLLSRDFGLLSLLCFACGMQNACFASLTLGQIRTTHLTGITTDMGTTWVKLRYMDPEAIETKRLRRVNAIRMGTFASFSVGSMIAAILFNHLGYRGFAVVVCFSVGIWAALALRQRKADRFEPKDDSLGAAA